MEHILKLLHLYRDLGVKDLLAEGTVVQHKCVHVQQVLLQIIHRGELLVTALTHVLSRCGHIVHSQVLQ